MRHPQKATILLTALIVVVGISGRAGLVTKSEPVVVSPVARLTTSSLRTSVEKNDALPKKFSGAKSRSLEISKLAAHSLSSDATALVAEMCDLQLLANGTRLELTSRQWSTLAAVVVRNQAVRQNYEAQIATSTMVTTGQYRVDIPVYAKAGDTLRGNFIAELQTELGSGIAADVLAKIGDRLEARFAGFGVSTQTLEIVASPGAPLSDVQVIRTVTYWNSVEGSDRLTTRREMHFPAWEDPTGDTWSALLAMVKA